MLVSESKKTVTKHSSFGHMSMSFEALVKFLNLGGFSES